MRSSLKALSFHLLALLLFVPVCGGIGQWREWGSSSTSMGVGGPSALQWLLGTNITVDAFFDKHWEKRPLLVRRRNSSYYGGVSFSDDEFLSHVEAGMIQHGSDVHWSRYCDGKRRQRRMVGRATRPVAKRLLAQGFTAQVFAPQHLSAGIARICSRLEGEFQSLVGCSACLSSFPPFSIPASVRASLLTLLG